MKTPAVILLLAGLPGLAAWGQAPRLLTLQEIKPAADSNFVERVPAPGATWVEVSEPARMLAVAYGPGTNQHLGLFPLDETGRVTAATAPVRITLPKPAALATATNIVAGMATHPVLPLLYVLQDIATYNQQGFGDPKTNVVFQQLDRLFVYRLDPTNVQLVATIRGEYFYYGQFHTAGLFGAPLAVDAANRRLYLPNLRDPEFTNEVRSAFGYLDLDDQGLPVMVDGQAAPPHLQQTFSASAPVGFGWVPLSRDRVVLGCYFGLMTWAMDNRRAPVTAKNYGGPDWSSQIVGHPTLPIVYRTTSHIGRIMAIDLVDGYPSLFPQELDVAYTYRPQVMASRHQLAVGRAEGIFLVNLDAQGKLTPTVTSILVADFTGNALRYSPRFDRLYVAAGKAP